MLRFILINIVDVNLQQMPTDTKLVKVSETPVQKIQPKQTSMAEKTPTKPTENTKINPTNKENIESEDDDNKIEKENSETSDENIETSEKIIDPKPLENDKCIPSEHNKCNLLDQKSDDSIDDNLKKNSIKAYAKNKRREDFSNSSRNEDFSNKKGRKNNSSPLNVRIKSVNSNSYLSIHGDQLISKKNNGSIFKIENDILGVLISTENTNSSNRSRNRNNRSFLCMKDKTVRFCSQREIKKNQNAYRDNLYEHWSLINNGSGFMISSGSKCLRQYYNSNNGSYALKVDLCPSRNGMDTNFYFTLEPMGGVNNVDTNNMYAPDNGYSSNRQSRNYSDPNRSMGPSKNNRKRRMRRSPDDRNRYLDERDQYREEEYRNRQGRGKHSYKKRPRRHSKDFDSYGSSGAYEDDLPRSNRHRQRQRQCMQSPPVGYNNMERNRCIPNRSIPNNCNTMRNMQFQNPPVMNNTNQMNNICKPNIPCYPNMQHMTPIPQYKYSQLLNEISDASDILNHSKLLKPVEMKKRYFKNYENTPLPINGNSPTTTLNNKGLVPLPQKNNLVSNLVTPDISKTSNKIIIDCKGLPLIECQKTNQQSFRP